MGLKGTRLSTPKLHTKRITRVRQPICRFGRPPASLLFPVVVFVLFFFSVQLLLPTFDCFHSMLFFFIHLIFPYVFRITFPKLYIFALCALFSISIQSSVKFPSPMFYSFFPLLRFCFDPPSLHPAHGYFLFMSLFLLIVSNSAASLFFVKFFFLPYHYLILFV